jgi:glycosyltransferase involved in cell wall biosynthesis
MACGSRMSSDHSNELPSVSIVVPTRNSGRTLAACLASIRAQTYANVQVIVVDNSSSDATQQIASESGYTVLTAGPERSAQRNEGARHATGSHLLFVDSDMVLEPGVVQECVAAASAGAAAVIIPEISFGEGFWAGCKALERSLYVGDDDIEAARFYERDLFAQLDGFDEELNGPEDWDLSQRARRGGAVVDRTTSVIHHDEGRLRLGALLKKKYGYGKSYPAYRRKHRGVAARQSRLVRPAYVRRRQALAQRPATTAGMLAMKSLELVAGAGGALSTLVSRRGRTSSRLRD